MSDTFDHEAEAWDDRDRREDADDDLPTFMRRRKEPRREYVPYQRPEPTYQAFPLIREVHETEKAHLVVFTFDDEDIERWLPKSQCRIPYADLIEISTWLVGRIKDEINGR
ncbi:hypothetical protein RIVERRIDER_45 [Xanthomonas phage RiverRider]|uniref:Uncharacterized protein n=1 Tax=Xanthomonas phage RiverRider TaxID=2108116 RepID=A0A2P1JUU9_9CAUD|nr:hypothetical protein HWB58_gp90 [Xanthomonas phage RiverRider]AVO23126.1 hypothetical protein RIVERRIDER_45 [Xanthomonas phage RiverRider]